MCPLLREPRDVWSRLFLYESRDQAARLYQERNSLEANAAKLREINAAFAQAREYFEAAADAAELIRPLLQYYGVLALARGTVLFCRPEMRERSLSQGHGIQITGWDGIDGSDAARLDELNLKFTGGTFAELALATKNRELQWLDAEVTDQLFHGDVRINKPRPAPANGTSVQVHELLRRLPALSDLYEEMFDRASACHSATVLLKSDAKRAEIIIYRGRESEEQMKALLLALQLGPGAVLQQVADPAYFGKKPFFNIAVKGDTPDALATSLPPIQRVPGIIGMGESVYVIEPLTAGFALSPLLALHALAYFLGMLVRYYPSTWRTMLNREKGDFLYPLLQLAVSTIRDDYPRFVLEELEN